MNSKKRSLTLVEKLHNRRVGLPNVQATPAAPSQKKEGLFAGPWLGEFGWELCQWQGHVRYLAKTGGFNRVVVCSYEGHSGMYKDFMTEFVPVPAIVAKYSTNRDMLNVKGCPTSVLATLPRYFASYYKECELIAAPTSVDIPYCQQLWANWSTPAVVDPMLIALVKRDRAYAARRNWHSDKWDELKMKLEGAGFNVVYVPSSWDDSLRMFSTCSLAVGGSTGGMHLASLCKCPYFVWGNFHDGDMADRYYRRWNPHSTPLVVGDIGWDPSVGDVFNFVLGAHTCIGRKAQF